MRANNAADLLLLLLLLRRKTAIAQSLPPGVRVLGKAGAALASVPVGVHGHQSPRVTDEQQVLLAGGHARGPASPAPGPGAQTQLVLPRGPGFHLSLRTADRLQASAASAPPSAPVRAHAGRPWPRGRAESPSCGRWGSRDHGDAIPGLRGAALL